MKSHTRPSDREDSFSAYIDQRDPKEQVAEARYAAVNYEYSTDDTPEDYVDRAEIVAAVRRALQTLTPREQEFVKKVYGIDCNSMTAEEIGQHHRISSSRVYTIVRGALLKLSNTMRSPALRNFGERKDTPKKGKKFFAHPIFGPKPEQYLVPRVRQEV